MHIQLDRRLAACSLSLWLASTTSIAAADAPPSAVIDATVRITVTNVGPEGGAAITPLWFGFHDGSYRVFEDGKKASPGLEHLAEDGLSGAVFLDEDVLNYLVSGGLPVAEVTPISDMLVGEFGERCATKECAQPLQGTIIPAPLNPMGLAFFPGDSNSAVRVLRGEAEQLRFLSYASMVFPTNDGFIADEQPLEIFDEEGNFVGADVIVMGSEVWDAGTEVNDETFESVPFVPSGWDVGEHEHGAVHKHTGLLPPGEGGLLDLTPFFPNADFLAPGYQVVRIQVELVTEQ